VLELLKEFDAQVEVRVVQPNQADLERLNAAVS
jgi:hypothetical protein